ncbi:MAG TPA: sugar phosphate isomerase/epimerase family protein [Sphaerochaeta sp.]|nr:sugar phosphate isomerase/epimerase family protein [Sphaerochaeta sp.]
MFFLSGFSDEICDDFNEQMRVWRAMDLKHFELRSAWGINVMQLTDDQLEEIKQIIEPINVSVACIGSPIGKSNIEDDFSFERERLERAIVVAKYFDCKFIRIFSFYSSDGDILQKKTEVMQRLRKMAEMAAAEDIVLLHENESNTYGELSIQSVEIAETLASKNFGLVFDPANYSMAGEDALEAEKNMHDYINYLHIKDFSLRTKTMVFPGDGDSYIREIVEKLKGEKLMVALEPHLEIAGQFGGFTGEIKFMKTVSIFKNILDEIGIDWA